MPPASPSLLEQVPDPGAGAGRAEGRASLNFPAFFGFALPCSPTSSRSRRENAGGSPWKPPSSAQPAEGTHEMRWEAAGNRGESFLVKLL